MQIFIKIIKNKYNNVLLTSNLELPPKLKKYIDK